MHYAYLFLLLTFCFVSGSHQSPLSQQDGIPSNLSQQHKTSLNFQSKDSSDYPSFQQNNHKRPAYRALDTQDIEDTPNLLYEVGSLDMPFSNFRYSLYQVNETHLKLFAGEYILTLDVADYMSPKVVAYTNFFQPISIVRPVLSPDGESMLEYTDKEDMLIRSTSDPQHPMNLSWPGPQQAVYGFCAFSSNQEGYLAIQNLYHFQTSPKKITLIAPLTSSETYFILLSHDSKTVFVAFDYADYGTHLKIIDVSNPTNTTVLSNFHIDSPEDIYEAFSGVLSSDSNTLFISFSRGIQIFDVSDRTNPIKLSTMLSGVDTIYPQGISLSPDEQTLITWPLDITDRDYTFVVDVSDLKSPQLHKFTGQIYYSPPMFSPDGQFVFMTFAGKFTIARLLINARPSTSLSYNPSSLDWKMLPQDSRQDAVGITPDAKTALTCNPEGITFYNITDEQILVPIGSKAISANNCTFAFSADSKMALIDLSDTIYIVNISNQSFLSSLPDKPQRYVNNAFFISLDGKTLMKIDDYEDYTISALIFCVAIYDLTDPVSPKSLGKISNLNCSAYNDLVYTTNWNISVLLFANPPEMNVYDISNISSPNFLSRVEIRNPGDLYEVDPIAATISPDGQTLFSIIRDEFSTRQVLQLYDLSNPANVTYLSSTLIARNASFANIGINSFSFVDNNTLLLSSSDRILIIDFSTRSAPFIVGFLTDPSDQFVSVPSAVHYSDQQTSVFLIANQSEALYMATVTRPYDVVIPVPVVGRGEVVMNDLLVLESDPLSRYNLVSKNQRVIGIFQYNVTWVAAELTAVYSVAPTWIIFDTRKQIIRMHPTSLDDTGDYYLSCSTLR